MEDSFANTIVERIYGLQILAALACARDGVAVETAFSGGREAGRFRFDENGDVWAAGWDSSGLLWLEGDHERVCNLSSAGAVVREVRRRAPKPIVTHLEPLVTAVGGEANAAFWVAATSRFETTAGESDRWQLVLEPIEDALDPSTYDLRHFFSLQDGDVDMAKRLARRAMAGDAPVELPRGEFPSTENGAKWKAAELLAEIGVSWFYR